MTSPLESLEHSRRRLTLLILALSGVAATLAWGLTLPFTRQTSGLDFVLLPLGLLNFGVLGLVVTGRLSYQIGQIVPVMVLTLYQLGSLFEFALGGLMYTEGFSSTAMWFPLLYPLVYLLMPYRRALSFSLIYLGLAFAVLALTLPGAWTQVKPTALNTVVQFYLTNVIYLLLLSMYARYRHSFYQMRLLAESDPLTGLPNRRSLEPQMMLALGRSSGCGVLMLDLDHFKQVNDLHGHATGDQVLREVALRMNHALQGGELLARWGGEEFVVFAPLPGGRDLHTLAEHLREVIEAQPLAGVVRITVSVGVAEARAGETHEGLLKRADHALYQAKNRGRNRVEVWTAPTLSPLQIEQIR